MPTHNTFTKQLSAASATGIAASQAAVNGTALTLTASPAVIDTFNSLTNSETGRRVLLTSTSGSETATVQITGTNSSGNIISEVVAFGTALTVQSANDYVTITQVLPTSSPVGSLSAGTNGVGASRWYLWNFMGNSPMNIGFAVELVTGSVNYTVQYSYDSPSLVGGNPTAPAVPLAFNTAVVNEATTMDGTISTPIVATRVLINSGTGEIRCRFEQAGIG